MIMNVLDIVIFIVDVVLFVELFCGSPRTCGTAVLDDASTPTSHLRRKIYGVAVTGRARAGATTALFIQWLLERVGDRARRPAIEELIMHGIRYFHEALRNRLDRAPADLGWIDLDTLTLGIDAPGLVV